MLEITDTSLEVKIGESLYALRPTFGSMVALAKLQDQLSAEGENDPARQMETLGSIKSVILRASDIPESIFDGLSIGQIRQIMGGLMGTITAAGAEPGKN